MRLKSNKYRQSMRDLYNIWVIRFFFATGRLAHEVHTPAADPPGQSRRTGKGGNQRERTDGRKVKNAQSAGDSCLVILPRTLLIKTYWLKTVFFKPIWRKYNNIRIYGYNLFSSNRFSDIPITNRTRLLPENYSILYRVLDILTFRGTNRMFVQPVMDNRKTIRKKTNLCYFN